MKAAIIGQNALTTLLSLFFASALFTNKENEWHKMFHQSNTEHNITGKIWNTFFLPILLPNTTVDALVATRTHAPHMYTQKHTHAQQ